MKILTSNSKLKKDNILAFNIPALFTCPMAGECKKFCYAKKGNYTYKNVQKSHKLKFEISKRSDFAILLHKELNKLKIKPFAIRIHSSGDFYSLEYAKKWMDIARCNKDVTFYAYTKMVSMFKYLQKTNQIPENVKIIYSLGGKQDKLINTKKDNHAMIFKGKPVDGYTDCSKSDKIAVETNNNKIGLTYH